jgi:hypothetical protein
MDGFDPNSDDAKYVNGYYLVSSKADRDALFFRAKLSYKLKERSCQIVLRIPGSLWVRQRQSGYD